MNAQKKNIFTLFAALATVAMVGGNLFAPVTAYANEAEQNSATEIIYYDDIIYQDDMYHGLGTRVAVEYSFDCDEIVIEDWAAQPSAPSYGNNDSSMTNICGPMAATNIIVYYDRWATNLVPNFDPGMVSYGQYTYFPDMEWPAVNAVTVSLYNLMDIASVGGTTSANFKSGLNTYVANQGYSITYTNCYSSATSLNLSTLKTALNAGKVALVMCSAYNIIYAINNNTTEEIVYYTQYNSNVGHMMMVYGYKTLGYYLNGVKVGEDTLLLVSTGYNTQEQGYMRLHDFSTIDEAWIMYIA